MDLNILTRRPYWELLSEFKQGITRSEISNGRPLIICRS